ncbi:outer membrane protein [Holospora obtusa F1]|uniref:Outer membrane protein n=1 Tax=Holospora obtusa F1 TaxID=1399147 RepID=W6TF75_HOLOB|nr:OmpH family outer membrane protein [Holospora obtusa]ETZ07634.1 outer membrane protein [Holospora obtusa F1]
MIKNKPSMILKKKINLISNTECFEIRKVQSSKRCKRFLGAFFCFFICNGVYGEDSQDKKGEASKNISIKKTGIVSLSGIVEILPAYRVWRKDMEGWKTSISNKLIREKTDLEKEWRKLEGLKGSLEEKTYNEKKKTLEGRLTKLEQSHTDMQQKFYVAEQSVIKFLDQEMQRILDDLCSKYGISLVLNAAIVLHVDRSEINISIVDLTSEVARLMEKRISTLKEYVPGAK